MTWLSRSLYRVRQFGRALGAQPSPDDEALLAAYLSPAERALFDATSPRDQHHHIRTLRLLPAPAPSRELARAALLHDIGKGYIRLDERVLYVLLAAGAPALLGRLARGRFGRRGPLAGVARIHHHARVGADLLRALGAEPRLIDLVARHHDRDATADPDLASLIDADERA
ncbi:MAG: HDIG domain-containing protein [Dehalococcoidia bacterium]